MKKLLLIGFLLLAPACLSPSGNQTVTPTPAEPPILPTSTIPASPTPMPATVTPELTSTPEPSPTPLPRYFTHEFDTSLEGWVILQAGNPAVPTVITEGGALRFQLDSPYTWLYGLYSPQEYADIHVETEYVTSGASPASVGLVCRYKETEGWIEYNVYTDGTYSVLYSRWLDTGIADYLPILDGSSNEISQSGATQQIGLTCSGTTAQLFINGTLIRSANIAPYELVEGKVGITASSFENTPVTAIFNWVDIREP